MPENLTFIAMIAGAVVVGMLTIGLILARLYTRASKEISFVRTGFGGQKVIMNGGALVFPVLHEVIPVNMNTLRLAVQRANEQALITRDRMRVDVIAEFYVRAQPTAEAIANAAQTLGARTMQPEKLKDLVEGKFVDALRSVAAEMSMEELHEKRVEFVQKVQQAVSEDLLKNGLELETVSLTGLDQTGMEFFNPNNAFDAEGLTRLTEEIEQRKKIRNDIEQDTAVQIKNKNLEAEKDSLEIAKEEEYARLAQEREVEIRRAGQMAEIAKEQADRQRDAEQAKIIAERAVEEERIEKEKLVKEREIAKNRAVETQDIERAKAVEIANQERDIAISVKSKEQSEAAAEADAARAFAVKAEEQVSTARETEVADRQKQIELIEAAKEAEREALAITIAAEAEKTAASDSAEALRETARGEADKARITAEAEAEAEKMRAAASEIRYAVEATGTKALNEAANLLSSDQIDMKVKLELIGNLESIIRESAKPMEAIDDIKIIQLDGLNGATAANVNGEAVNTGNGDGNLADKVVSSALKYRAQAPLIDSLMAEVGLKADDLNGLTGSFKSNGAEDSNDKS
ncbi:MAG: flotillin family protein [Kordiimonadaceae bacterium]|nr:flotillin family protein [Kordiimonadaceae bacterium]MBO6568878.1 flotillin family protein [Kordiimonadaceae bacterium]MBO6965147.1 flotillin family protein [Kordiimonadaceae bacterium]